MNVTVENLAPCKKLVRVELDATAVDAAFAAAEKDFQKQANLPGFRPGKAPNPMDVRKYDSEIKDEVKRTLIGDSYQLSRPANMYQFQPLIPANSAEQAMRR